MAAEEDGTLIPPPTTLNTSDLENMTVTPDHRHGTFDYIMETEGTFFADDHLSEEISEQYTEVPANVNYTRGGSLGEMGKHDLSNFSMVEHEHNHMSHHHDHGNMSMGMMMDHDHEFDHVHEGHAHAHAHGGNLSMGMMMDHDHEYDHAHGGRQLMMEIGILTSLVMLILALVILLVIPSNR